MRSDGKIFPAELFQKKIEMNGRIMFTTIVQDSSEREYMKQMAVEAGERERTHLRNELHDSVGQQLTGAAYMLHSLESRYKDEMPSISVDVKSLSKIIHRTLYDLRRIGYGLCPAFLTPEKGIEPGLRRMCDEIEGIYGINCRLTRCDPFPSMRKELLSNLFYLAQEAALNAVKHGNPRLVTLLLRVTDRQVFLEIKDDGCGFDPGEILPGRGLGLGIMRYRAETMGGSLKIYSKAGEGSRVTFICLRKNLGHSLV